MAGEAEGLRAWSGDDVTEVVCGGRFARSECLGDGMSAVVSQGLAVVPTLGAGWSDQGEPSAGSDERCRRLVLARDGGRVVSRISPVGWEGGRVVARRSRAAPQSAV